MKKPVITALICAMMLGATPAGTAEDQPEFPTISQSCENGFLLGSSEAAVLQDVVAAERAAKYQALLAVYSEAELDAFDDLLAQNDNLFESFFVTPLQGTSATAQHEVAREGITGSAGAEIIKKVLSFAEGSTPSVITVLGMDEKSKHEDYWTFYAAVQSFSTCTAVGNSAETLAIEDKYGSTEHYFGLFDLPLAQGTADASQITNVDVYIEAQVCRFGWFSGKAKGCSKDLDRENVRIEVDGVDA